jgi:thiol-disulfide isomerase/thioredoxin
VDPADVVDPADDADAAGEQYEPAGGEGRAGRRRQRARGRVTLVLIAAVGLFLGVVLGALLLRVAQGSGDSASPEQIQAKVKPDALGLPGLTNAGTDAAVGLVAPSISGKGFDGKAVSVTPDGRPRAIVVLAHWCTNCQHEVPELVELAEQQALPGVDVVAVVTATSPDRPNYPPSAWLQRERWPFPAVVDTDGAMARSFGVDRVPVLVLVDAQGRIAARVSGVSAPAEIASMFAALVAGTPISVPTQGPTSPTPTNGPTTSTVG